jgi:hypothetical protein
MAALPINSEIDVMGEDRTLSNRSPDQLVGVRRRCRTLMPSALCNLEIVNRRLGTQP